jgi:hypothetical protein
MTHFTELMPHSICKHADIVAVDIDNDGDLDIIVSGITGQSVKKLPYL